MSTIYLVWYDNGEDYDDWWEVPVIACSTLEDAEALAKKLNNRTKEFKNLYQGRSRLHSEWFEYTKDLGVDIDNPGFSYFQSYCVKELELR